MCWLMEDLLFSRVMHVRPVFSSQWLARLSPLAAAQDLAVLQLMETEATDTELLEQLSHLSLPTALRRLVVELSLFQETTPSGEEFRPSFGKIVILQRAESAFEETDSLSPYLAYLQLTPLVGQELHAETRSLVKAARNMGNKDLAVLAELRRWRIIGAAGVSDDELQTFRKSFDEKHLSPRLRAEVGITYGHLLYPFNPAVARSVWQEVAEWISEVPDVWLLRIQLAHAYARVGEMKLALPLYEMLLKASTVSFRIRAMRELDELDVLVPASCLPAVDDPSPSMRTFLAKQLVQQPELAGRLELLQRLLADADSSVCWGALQELQNATESVQQRSGELKEAFLCAQNQLLDHLQPELMRLSEGSDARVVYQALRLRLGELNKHNLLSWLSRMPSLSVWDQVCLIKKIIPPFWSVDAEPFLPFLQSPHQEVRLATIRMLAQARDRKALPALRALLAEPELKLEVMRALLALGDIQTLGQLVPMLAASYDAIHLVFVQLDALHAAGKVSIAELEPWLDNAELAPQLWRWIAQSKWERPDLWVSALAKALAQQNAEVQLAALGMLAHYSGLLRSSLEESVRDLLYASDSEVRWQSLELLLDSGTIKPADLTTLLQDRETRVRLKALDLLQQMQEANQVQPLILAELRRFEPQSEGKEALFGDWLAALPQSVQSALVTSRLDEPQFCQWLLETRSRHRLELESEVWASWFERLTHDQQTQLFDNLVALKEPKLLDLLLPRLADPDPERQAQMILLLATSERRELAPRLEPFLLDTRRVLIADFRYRLPIYVRNIKNIEGFSLAVLAYYAAFQLHSEHRYDYLRRMLTAAEPGLRTEALAFVPLQADREQLELLVPMLQDTDSELRWRVEKLLVELIEQRFDRQAKALLEPFFAHEHWLTLLQDVRADRQLLGLRALSALAEPNLPAIYRDAVRPFACSGNHAEQLAALKILGQLQDRGQIPVLVNTLRQSQDWQVLAAALDALTPLMDEALWLALYQELMPHTDANQAKQQGFEEDAVRRLAILLIKTDFDGQQLPKLFALAAARAELNPVKEESYLFKRELVCKANVVWLDFYAACLEQTEPVKRRLAIASLERLCVDAKNADWAPRLLELAEPLLADDIHDLRHNARLIWARFASESRLRKLLPAFLKDCERSEDEIVTILAGRLLSGLADDVRRLLPNLPTLARTPAVKLLTAWLGPASLPDVLSLLARIETEVLATDALHIAQRTLLGWIGELGGLEQCELLEAYLLRPQLKESAQAALIRLGDSKQRRLVLELLQSEKAELRGHGLKLASHARNADVLKAVIRLLSDSSRFEWGIDEDQIDQAAQEAIAKMLRPKDLPLLLQTLENTDAQTAGHLESILGICPYSHSEWFRKAEEIVPLLQPYLASAEQLVFELTTDLLAATTSPEAWALLVPFLISTQDWVQSHVRSLLVCTEHEALTSYLESLLPGASASLHIQLEEVIQARSRN